MVVGHQGRNVTACTRQRPNAHPNCGGTHGKRQVLLDQRPRWNDFAHVLLDRLDVQIVHLRQHLGHAKEPDHGGNEVDAGRQLQRIEGQARLGRERVQPHGRDQDPEGSGKNPLGHRVAREPAHQQQAHHGQQKVVARAEHQGQLRDHRRRDGQHRNADKAANHRHHGGQADHLPSQTHFGQRVAVEGGGHRRRCARDIEQNGAARAAIDAAQKDAGNQHQRILNRPLEGKGDQDRHRHGDRQARNGADVNAGKGADGGQQQQPWVDPGGKKWGQNFHH